MARVPIEGFNSQSSFKDVIQTTIDTFNSALRGDYNKTPSSKEGIAAFFDEASTQEYRELATSIPSINGLMLPYITNPSSVSSDELRLMVNSDPVVRSCVENITSLIASFIGEYSHPNPEIKKLVDTTLQGIGNKPKLKEIVQGAVIFGFYVGLNKWDSYTGTIDEIMTLPQRSLIFAVDYQGKPVGVMQNTLFGAYAGNSWGNNKDPVSQGDRPYPNREVFPPNFPAIPLRLSEEYGELTHFSINSTYPNPYGNSLLRSCYTYWTIKMILNGLTLEANEKHIFPATILYVSPELISNEDRDTFNDIMNNLSNRISDTVIGLSGKKGEDIDLEFIRQDPQALKVLQEQKLYCDEMIRTALFSPSGLTSSGSGYSSVMKQQDNQHRVLRMYSLELIQCLMKYIVKPIIKSNFGEQEEYGKFAEAVSTDQELTQFGMGLEMLAKNNVLDLNNLEDVNWARSKVGLSGVNKIIENNRFGDNSPVGGVAVTRDSYLKRNKGGI